MKPVFKLLLTGCLAILLTDVLGSLISKQFNFNYAYLAPLSLIVYSACGFWGTRAINLKSGVLIAAGIGLFDSTIGWKIAILLHANTGNFKNEPTIQSWIVTMFFVTGLAALCGLIGGVVANAFRKKMKYS
jgi:hypothetical protein